VSREPKEGKKPRKLGAILQLRYAFVRYTYFPTSRHTHTRAHVRARAHTHTHTPTHTHTHTHIHTNTLLYNEINSNTAGHCYSNKRERKKFRADEQRSQSPKFEKVATTQFCKTEEAQKYEKTENIVLALEDELVTVLSTGINSLPYACEQSKRK